MGVERVGVIVNRTTSSGVELNVLADRAEVILKLVSQLPLLLLHRSTHLMELIGSLFTKLPHLKRGSIAHLLHLEGGFVA